MELKKFFESVGGDYESVMTRLPSESMILKFVKKFLDDPSFSQLEKAFGDGDVHAAFLAVHTLKGTSASLGLDDLAREASALTEKLRGASHFPEDANLEGVLRAYERTVSVIKEL